MIASQLVYSIMITIVIVTTVNGNCPEEKKTYPIVTITNTSVNATPGMILHNCCTVYPSRYIWFCPKPYKNKLILKEAVTNFPTIYIIKNNS